MKTLVSLLLVAAVSVLPVTALAQPCGACVPSGKFSRAEAEFTPFFAVTSGVPASGQRFVDLHVVGASPSTLTFTGVTVANTGAYETSWWWWYNQTEASVAAQLAGTTTPMRAVILKGYQISGNTLYVVVTVENSGQAQRSTVVAYDVPAIGSAYTDVPGCVPNGDACTATCCSGACGVEETCVPSLMQSLGAGNRVIDVSTWLDGAGTRHYAGVAIPNTGSDYIPLPGGAFQVLELPAAGLQTWVMQQQSAQSWPARVIDVESEGNGQVLALIAYDGALRNIVTDATATPPPVAPDSWFYPTLSLQTGVSQEQPEQSLNHVMLSTGARVISAAPDGAGYDVALLQNQALPISPPPTSAPVGSPGANQMAQFGYLDNRVQTFMRQYDVTGAAVAIAYGNALVYTRAYGYADTELATAPNPYTPAMPNTMFRIGSISKMMATTAILYMIDQKWKTPGNTTLTLQSKIFPEILRPYLGLTVKDEGAAASENVWCSQNPTLCTAQSGLEDITVAQLLSHSAGFDDSNCSDTSCGGQPLDNPLAQTVCIAGEVSPPLTSTPTCQQIVKEYMYDHELQWPPGQYGMYSNYGFCVAQVVVNALANGVGYQQFVYNSVLSPAHIWDASTGDWLFTPGLDTYTPSSAQTRDYVFPWTGLANSALVPQGPPVDPPYGSLPMFDGLSAGAWKASATAVLKYAVSINQSSPSTPQIISAARFESMFALHSTGYDVDTCENDPTQTPTPVPSPGGISYGLALQSFQAGADRYKDGKIPGGGGFMVFTNLTNSYVNHSCADCITWVALVNTNDYGQTEPDTADGINGAMGDALNQNNPENILSAITSVTPAAIAAQTAVDFFPTYVGP